MRISAKADYAVRAAVELAAVTDDKPLKAERIATSQDIPLNFLENILGELRHAGIVRSQRGAEGGFRLARAANDVTVADVIRAVEGPLATVRGGPPEDSAYPGRARHPRRRRERPSASPDRPARGRSRGVDHPAGLGLTETRESLAKNPVRCSITSRASSSIPRMKVDLRRRSTGSPRAYRPGLSTTPPS